MPLVTSQPPARHNIPDSILEANSLKVSRAVEWENEWNHSGLASGLTPEVKCKAILSTCTRRCERT